MARIRAPLGGSGGGVNPTTGTTKANIKVNLGFKPRLLVWYGAYNNTANSVDGVYLKDFSETTYYYDRNSAVPTNKTIGATVDEQGVLYELDNEGFMLKNSASSWANVEYTYIAYP